MDCSTSTILSKVVLIHYNEQHSHMFVSTESRWCRADANKMVARIKS